MQIPMRSIEKACETDGDREALRHVWLRGEELIASDGKIMAIIPIDRDPDDVDGPIQPRAFELARHVAGRYGTMRAGPEKIVIKDQEDFLAMLDRQKDVKPMDWDAIKAPKTKPAFEVGLDLALLTRLIEAMGCQRVKLRFYKPNDVVQVEEFQGRGRGFIMPLYIEGAE